MSLASVAGFQVDIPSPEIDDIILSNNKGHTQSFVPNFSANSDSKLYHNASVDHHLAGSLYAAFMVYFVSGH